MKKKAIEKDQYELPPFYPLIMARLISINDKDISERSISKIVINRSDIEKSGALDVVDVLKYFDGIDVKQNGQRGQLASLFIRGTNSNHTLVLLNLSLIHI